MNNYWPWIVSTIFLWERFIWQPDRSSDHLRLRIKFVQKDPLCMDVDWAILSTLHARERVPTRFYVVSELFGRSCVGVWQFLNLFEILGSQISRFTTPSNRGMNCHGIKDYAVKLNVPFDFHLPSGTPRLYHFPQWTEYGLDGVTPCIIGWVAEVSTVQSDWISLVYMDIPLVSKDIPVANWLVD